MRSLRLITDSLLIIIVCLVLFSLYASSYHLITPDEGRYVEVAREMLAQHQFVTPYLNGTAFLDKPILYYWIEAFFINTFGLNEWAARLLPISFATLGCVMNYLAGASLYNRRTGWLSALILMSSILYFGSAHYADMDLMVAILISTSLWLFIIAMQVSKEKIQYSLLLWLAYIFAGLAFLTKGLMGIVFPMMIIGCWIICYQNWRLLLRMRIITGLILFLLIVTPWFLAVEKANPEFFNYFFVVQQFNRYTATGHFNMQKPFYFYLVVIIAGFLPWTLFLFQAIISQVKAIYTNYRYMQKEMFLILWPLILLIFFSIPSSKIVGYILPVFPPLALIIAHYITRSWEQFKFTIELKVISFLFLIFAILTSLTFIILAHMPKLTTIHSSVYFIIMSFILALGSVILVLQAVYQPEKVKQFFITFMITTSLTMIAVMAGAHSFKLSTTKPLAMLINKHIQPNDKVMEFFSYSQELPVYLQRNVYVVADWDNPKLVNTDNWERELAEDVLYKHYRQQYLILPQELAQQWNGQQRIFLLLQTRSVNLLKSTVHPIFYLASYGQTILVSNKPSYAKQNTLILK